MIVALVTKMFLLGSIMGLGYYLDRSGKISRQGLQALSTLVIHFLLPSLTFATLIENFSREMLHKAGPLPLLGFVTFAVGMVLGLATVRLVPMSSDARKTTIFLASVNNYGYLPLPLVYMLYGQSGAALLFFQNLGCHLFFWTVGIWGLTGGAFSTKAFRNILNNNFYALWGGLVLVLLGWQKYIPSVLVDLARLLGLGAIPLVMVVIGSTLSEIGLGKGLPWKLLTLLSVVRLVIVPALMAGIIFVIPLPRTYQMICLLVALMPCASSAPIFVKEYGGDKELAAQAVLVTTLASLVTIPLGLAFFHP